MKKISKFLALITAMLMLVTVLAACGSSDNGGNDGTGDEDTQGNADENQGQDDSQSDDGNTGDDTAGDDTAESDLAYVQDKGHPCGGHNRVCSHGLQGRERRVDRL